MLNSLFQAFRLWGWPPERCEQEKGKKDEGVGVGSHRYFFPSTHSITKKANYWQSKKGWLAETINMKVSGKVNLKSSTLNLFLIHYFSWWQSQKHRKTVICRIIKNFLLSQEPVSHNANSASTCKFESNPSILNRIVLQVLVNESPQAGQSIFRSVRKPINQ